MLPREKELPLCLSGFVNDRPATPVPRILRGTNPPARPPGRSAKCARYPGRYRKLHELWFDDPREDLEVIFLIAVR